MSPSSDFCVCPLLYPAWAGHTAQYQPCTPPAMIRLQPPERAFRCQLGPATPPASNTRNSPLPVPRAQVQNRGVRGALIPLDTLGNNASWPLAASWLQALCFLSKWTAESRAPGGRLSPRAQAKSQKQGSQPAMCSTLYGPTNPTAGGTIRTESKCKKLNFPVLSLQGLVNPSP